VEDEGATKLNAYELANDVGSALLTCKRVVKNIFWDCGGNVKVM